MQTRIPSEFSKKRIRKGRFRRSCIVIRAAPELALRAVELGLYVSFTGVVTFNKNVGTSRYRAAVPLDRMLVETDAPYLAPVPFRGKTNEPAYVVHTAPYWPRSRASRRMRSRQCGNG